MVGWEYNSIHSETSALHGGKSSGSCISRYSTGEEHPAPTRQKAGRGPQPVFGRGKGKFWACVSIKHRLPDRPFRILITILTDQTPLPPLSNI